MQENEVLYKQYADHKHGSEKLHILGLVSLRFE